MASDLELATRVEGGRGSYRAVLSRQWGIWGPNGGYLAAIALRAAGREAAIPQPRSFYGFPAAYQRYRSWGWLGSTLLCRERDLAALL